MFKLSNSKLTFDPPKVKIDLYLWYENGILYKSILTLGGSKGWRVYDVARER